MPLTANVRPPPHPKDPNCIETPLHQAAGSNDVAAIDAPLDAGADIDATGAIFTAGGPVSDAVIFANWDAARRLVERGAQRTTAEYLLARGAGPQWVGWDGKTPMHVAGESGHAEFVAWLHSQIPDS